MLVLMLMLMFWCYSFYVSVIYVCCSLLLYEWIGGRSE